MSGGRSSRRWYTVKVVVLTSLFWILIQSVFIVYPATNPTSKTAFDLPPGIRPGPGAPTIGQTEGGSDRGLLGRLLGRLIDRGRDGPGEMGKAVIIPDNQKEESKLKFKDNQFNLLASNLISLNRSLPDYRMDGCKSKVYASDLPNTSVVIVYHNEAWSTLLRTVHSVINKSPPKLLREIILVDDASDRVFPRGSLEEHVAQLSVAVQLIRMPSRSGLIRARLMGAARAAGQTITFLDAHCEATEGWLQPLVGEIRRNRKAVVCPIIDVISDETFEYITGSDMTWGGFNWRLTFRWYSVPARENTRRNNDRTQPLRTPTMAGGLFTIDRNYFFEIGSYDSGMEIWGGENLEMSFRVWMCGGELLIATCSRVGHVFRKTSPYSWPGGVANILNKNNMRTATVWMDRYKEFYFKLNPGVKETNYGDVTTRLQLRKKLQCKDFEWYLTNVYPESLIPASYFSLGYFRHVSTSACLDTMGRKSGEQIGLVSCHGMGGNQVFSYTKPRAVQTDDLCLDANSAMGPVRLVNCHGMGGNQLFAYDKTTLALKHVQLNRCLGGANSNTARDTVSLVECTGDANQQWTLQDMDWDLYKKTYG